MTREATCLRCGKAFALQHPVTFEVQGRLFDGRGFCGDACADAWARAEVLRLRGWLRRIYARCGGVAGKLARRALQTTLSITDDV